LPRCASKPASAAFSTSLLKRPVSVGMYSNYAATCNSFVLPGQIKCDGYSDIENLTSI
jgi:hypothetical protein